MSKFFTVRHPLTITVNDPESGATRSHTYYVRELGYQEFHELKAEVLSRRKDEADKDRSGLALMDAVVLACVEEKDSSPSYSAEEWRLELKQVVLQLGKASMKAQGFDTDAVQAEPMSEEEIEGNESPSRRSGTNSASAAAAQSAS